MQVGFRARKYHALLILHLLIGILIYETAFIPFLYLHVVIFVSEAYFFQEQIYTFFLLKTKEH